MNSALAAPIHFLHQAEPQPSLPKQHRKATTNIHISIFKMIQNEWRLTKITAAMLPTICIVSAVMMTNPQISIPSFVELTCYFYGIHIWISDIWTFVLWQSWQLPFTNNSWHQITKSIKRAQIGFQFQEHEKGKFELSINQLCSTSKKSIRA